MFKVNYTLTTRSRYGSYIYHYTETVEAETKEEAVAKVKAAAAKPRWKFTVKSAEEVEIAE